MRAAAGADIPPQVASDGLATPILGSDCQRNDHRYYPNRGMFLLLRRRRIAGRKYGYAQCQAGLPNG